MTNAQPFTIDDFEVLLDRIAGPDPHAVLDWLNEHVNSPRGFVFVIADLAATAGHAARHLAPGPISASMPVFPEDSPPDVVAVGRLLAAATMEDWDMLQAIALAVVPDSESEPPTVAVKVVWKLVTTLAAMIRVIR